MGLWVVLLVLILSLADCRVVYEHVYEEVEPPTKEQVSFMIKFGYLPGEEVDGAVYTAQSISAALKKMQAFAGLPQSGLLDKETRNLFKKKRCGVKDVEDTPTRSRRFVLQQGWNKKFISYRIINGSNTLDKDKVEELMADGLAMWAPHGGLQFTKEDDGPADIQVSFAGGDHGDGFPFDGPGRVVAHAFPPPHGAMHFDDDEIWGSDPEDEDDDITDFFAVAVHEIGHALGLSHSSEKASVMYPYYQVPIERLHMDDILGMQELYLQDQSTRNTLAPTPPVPRFTKADSYEDEDDIPDLCFTNYDTIVVLQGRIYVFEEEWVWVLSKRKHIEPGYPRRFHEVFRGLPSHVNVVRAAYEMKNGNIRVFSGRRYWEFDTSFQITNKGRIYEYGVPSDVEEFTTVFVSNYNNKTYLIEYERFWRFDEDTGRLDAGYPKEMSAWRKVPYPVDSAIIWKGKIGERTQETRQAIKARSPPTTRSRAGRRGVGRRGVGPDGILQYDTFFFRGPRFWRFDNTLIQAHEYYPLPTAQIWFPCARTDDMYRYAENDGP